LRVAESIATIHAALDAGMTLLIREALIRGRAREQAVLSVKFGLMRSPLGSIVGTDQRPSGVKNFPRLHAPQARGAYVYPRPVCARLSRDQAPNQRCRRVAANSSFSAARSAEGPRNGAVGAGPDKKSASTLPTKPPPNSM
jgi:hypothetical protein